MLGLLLLAGTMPASSFQVATVDLIEINHFGPKRDRHQVIFWDWCECCDAYRVRGWEWHRGREIKRHGRWYYLRADHDGAALWVRARLMRETSTSHDPEHEDTKYRRRELREPLWPRP